MHLIFIRHGDPDYTIDSLTAKGEQEAVLLGERMAKWRITKSYVSPMGRAVKTAQLALKRQNKKAEILNWLREFNYPVIDEKNGEKRIAWDWLPQEYIAEPRYFDGKEWCDTPTMKSGDMESHYREVSSGIDGILSGSGYKRASPLSFIYQCAPHLSAEAASADNHLDAFQPNLDDRTIVFFCHLGVMFAVIAHLTGMSPVQLWQGFFVAPSSVTVLGAEERVPGEAVFRVQTLGDCSHLLSAKEPPSASGFFGNCFAY